MASLRSCSCYFDIVCGPVEARRQFNSILKGFGNYIYIDVKKIARLLEWTIDGSENALLGDLLNIEAFKLLIKSRSSNSFAFYFFFTRFGEIHEFLSSIRCGHVMAEYVEEFVGTMDTFIMIKQMKDFLYSLQGYQYRQACLESLNRATILVMPTINWVTHNFHTFDEILQERPLETNTPMHPTALPSTTSIPESNTIDIEGNDDGKTGD